MVRLSSDLLYATLTLERRRRATLDDIERADALAELMLARRRRIAAAGTKGAPTRRIPAAAQDLEVNR